MKNRNGKVVSVAFIGLMAFVLNTGMTSNARADESETTIPAQTETAVGDPAPNGGTFTLRVVNKTNQPLVLLVDTNCARGPVSKAWTAARLATSATTRTAAAAASSSAAKSGSESRI